MSPLQQQWRTRLILNSLAAGAALSLVGVSLWWSEFNVIDLFRAGPRFTEFFSRLVPPDWSVTGLVFHSTLETLMMALAGTFLAVIVAFPLGFAAASNVTPLWASAPLKGILGMIRSVPLVVVAVLCVAVVGLGPFPGTLAIAFHSVGMLAKFYAEEFETAEEGIVQAVNGTGATQFQTLRFGLLPQCMPQVVAFTIFRFEMNFRDATVLGLVGAGGIGYYIQLYVGSFQYQKVAVLILVIVVVVALLDQATYWIRKRIR